jgi:hypothetical protein
MPTLIGFVLGVVVTIFGAYLYDAMNGNVGNGMTAEARAPMVNWDVVTNDWDIFEANMRAASDGITHAVRQHTS